MDVKFSFIPGETRWQLKIFDSLSADASSAPFVSKQKDAKIDFPTCVLAANEIASDFHAAVRMNSKSPAGLGLSRPTA